MATYLERQTGISQPSLSEEYISYLRLKPESAPTLKRLGESGVYFPFFGALASTLFSLFLVSKQKIKTGISKNSPIVGAGVVFDSCAIFWPPTIRYERVQKTSPLGLFGIASREGRIGDKLASKYFLDSVFSYFHILKDAATNGRVFIPPTVREETEGLNRFIFSSLGKGWPITSNIIGYLSYLDFMINVGKKNEKEFDEIFRSDPTADADTNIINWSKALSNYLKRDLFIFTRDQGMCNRIVRESSNVGVISMNMYGFPYIKPPVWVSKNNGVEEEFLDLLKGWWEVNSLEELLRV